LEHSVTGSYWIQIDVRLRDRLTRFYMQDCGGRDQVVRAVAAGGWTAYERPLPSIVARLCETWSPVVIDVGANTGYYSLLAASTGATRVLAFEPEPNIRALFASNVRESALGNRIQVSECALSDQRDTTMALHLPDAGHGLIETSASLNPQFRARHSGRIDVPVTTLDAFWGALDLESANPSARDAKDMVLKIDVESLEPQVLRGASRLIETRRPVIALELLPNTDKAFFARFMAERRYTRFHLKPSGQLSSRKDVADLSNEHRDHLLVPDESISRLAEALSGR
jgi:FkbM family methyltransferase